MTTDGAGCRLVPTGVRADAVEPAADRRRDEGIAAVPDEAAGPEGVAKRPAALRDWAAECEWIVRRRGDEAAPEVRCGARGS
ncbi:hypothetical protein [Prauserella muralis]|uniref:Uncharacterized protein n=1 Tax=Prauserella muralis TaxID=588067 RepID=A0A2V4AQ00_9PSEU|nr:hypothetical protein [Prauserella muralis]PXY22780.1 hypothetical protein BAY60_23605 [Prauserella muralis]TWE28520.1 hypothetical protein FHX69_1177 [Prauserella muralis]